MAFVSELPVLELFIDKTYKLENSGFVNKIRQEFTLDINIDLSRTAWITALKLSLKAN